MESKIDYRPHNKVKLSFLSLIIAVGSLFYLPGCTSTTTPTGTDTTSPTATTAATSEPTATTGSEGGQATGDDPIAATLPGGTRSGSDPLQMLQLPQVKKELNLTDDQVNKIKQVETDFRSEISNAISKQNLKELDPKKNPEKVEELRKQLDTQIQKTRKELSSVLSTDQLKRFKEISLQVYGWGPLTQADFAEDLKLTQEQQTKLVALREDMNDKIKEAWTTPTSSDAKEQSKTISENRTKIEKVITDINNQALDVLTADQKTALTKLKGKEFKLDVSGLAPTGS
jgi:Spy/CpxP family protein refolding chaperone